MSTKFLQEAHHFLKDAGYAESDIVSQCSFTARSSADALISSQVDLVAFSRSPHDMRAACIAAFEEIPGRKQETLALLRYLTSPLAIVGNRDKVEFWPIRKEAATHPVDVWDRDGWYERVRGRIKDYSPSAVADAKNDRIQLEFVDAGLSTWTQNITSNSLKRLLEKLMRSSLDALADRFEGNDKARTAVLRLIFQLFACRALEDKGIIQKGSDARECLTLAHNRFSSNVTPDVLNSTYLNKTIVDLVFTELRQSFSFETLTTDALAYSYENALVTSGMRHALGIYYTPRSLTEYILRRMPIEMIEQDKRVFWDPCAGCGSFLLAGFDRLSESLPTNWSGAARHKYLTKSIFGSDVDAFACEMAALALVLTDLHNRNGWLVREHDALTVSRSDLPREPSVIATNLPFREHKPGGVRREIAADILGNLIEVAATGALMAVVLPQSILDSRAATDVRKLLLKTCNILEIALFPGGLFESHAETAVLIFQKTGTESKSIATVRELRSADFDRFRRAGAFTRTYPADPAEWHADPNSRFHVSPMSDLWKTLEERFGKLTDFASVKNGCRLTAGDTTSVSDTKRDGQDRPYIDRTDFLRPFALIAGPKTRPVRWIRYGDQLDRARTSEIFECEKVLINANRNPGSAWRIKASISRETLYVSDNFHVVIPRNNIPVEILAAILNSPLANAWFDSRCRKRKVVQEILERLPFPSFDSVLSQEITKAVRAMEKAVVAKWRKQTEGMFFDEVPETSDTARLLSEIDELVYDAYGISKNERRQIDNLMRTDKRPV